MTSIVSIVNLLTLLRKEPQTWSQLYSSGCFYDAGHLGKTIDSCMKAGLITCEYLGRVKNPVDVVMSHPLHRKRWHKTFYFYYITQMGHTFLSFYSNWQVRKVDRSAKQVVVSEI